MLERLLQIVQAGGTHTLGELARGLEVTEQLVEMMIEELARMGRIAPVRGGCAGHCAACPVSGPCVVGGATRVWTLTDRGQGGRP